MLGISLQQGQESKKNSKVQVQKIFFFPSELNQHHQQTFLSLLRVQYMTFGQIFINLFFLFVVSVTFQHCHDDVLLCCRLGYDAFAALHLLPRDQPTGGCRTIWRHHDHSGPHPGALCRRHPDQPPQAQLRHACEKSETQPAVTSAGVSLSCFYWQIPNLNSCKVRRRAPADLLPSFPPQVGLSILVISTVIMSILSGIAVKDVLWTIFMPDVLTVAALMPLIGFTLGYVMSYICRLNPQ